MGIKTRAASEAIARRTFLPREMSTIMLSAECEIGGDEETHLSQFQLSPILSLSQEEFIVQNTHTENKKTFNFHNCSVNFFSVKTMSKMLYNASQL